MTAWDRSPLTPTLAALNIIAFLSFCNVAIFFQFHDHLETLSIDPRWFGFLMAVFSLLVMVARPFISPFIHPENARKWLLVSTGSVIAALLFYGPARTLETLILVIALVVWSTFASVFYFIESYGAHLGIQNAGWFLTSSIVAEIGIRIAGQKVLDRYDKPVVLGAGVACLGVGFLFLATISTRPTFLLVGFWLGLGWGVVVPLLTAIVFDRSKPRFRALNTNLVMSVFQGGFFLGPLLANAAILRWDQGVLYKVSGLILLMAVFPALMMRGKAGKGGD